MAANSPSPTVTEYGAFTPAAQSQLESVFLLKESGTAAQTVSGAVTFAGTVTLSAATTVSNNISQTLGTYDLQSFANNLVCLGNSGNAQNYANGLQLNAEINAIVTANANNNSAILPASQAGMQVFVSNANSGATIVLFPKQNEHINFSANNVGLSLASNNAIALYCPVAGTWMGTQGALG